MSPPTCPKCSSEMLLRKGSNGKFWGCSKYPTCRGSMNLRPEDVESEEEKFAERKEEYGTYWRDLFFAERHHWVRNMSSISPAVDSKTLLPFSRKKGICPCCGQLIDEGKSKGL